MKPTPELLAPAGSWEAFFAGLEAGADAFYLGLHRWSARGRAANFDVDEARRLITVAHEEKRKVYVTVNTLLKEQEVTEVIPAIWDLACAGVDALIIQDLGLWRICQQAFPELRLHASTQMSVHNSSGVRQLAAQGFARVVLARECTIPEIAAIHAATETPLEVFVHGALCYSVSGQCLASSSLLGRSANRGWCAQPCRWGYRKGPDDGEFHPLSPTDLNLVERVPELIDAGVSSLKIEGRLKGADYVHGVVRAYRKVLDAVPEQRESAIGAGREILRSMLGRPASEGYAYHPRPKDVLRLGGKPTFGKAVGRVSRWKDGHATIQTKEQLRKGDRIRIGTRRGGTGVSLVLRRISVRKRDSGYQVSFPCDDRLSRGDPVHKVRDARGEELEQRLAKEGKRSLPRSKGLLVDLEISFHDQQIGVEAICGPVAVAFSEPIESHPAERHPLDYGTLHKHVGRLGNSGYQLGHLRVATEIPPVVIPASAFKAVRQRLVVELNKRREAERTLRLDSAATLRGARGAEHRAEKQLWIRAEGVSQLKVLIAHPYHRLVLTMTRDCLRARDRMIQSVRDRQKIVWELPPWIAESDLTLYRKQLEVLAKEGYREVAATNLGHLDLVRDLPLRVHAGRELHALNGWAASALAELRCTSFMLSPETDRETLTQFAAAGWPIRPIAYTFGNIPAFVTRLSPGILWRRGGTLQASEEVHLHWSEAPHPLGQGWARVYQTDPLSWTQHMRECLDLGIGDFLFDFQGRPYRQHELEIILKKFRTMRPLKDTSDWNFTRGLV